MAKAGPRKTNAYGAQFKATAVRLLSRWRKQAREGTIVTKGVKIDAHTTAELKRLRELEKRYKVLREEHALLKKAIRFASARKRRSSSLSKQTGPNIKSR